MDYELRALEDGEIDAYPEYTSTALTSFFKTPPEDRPRTQQAFEDSQTEFEEEGLTAYPPTPRSRARTPSGCSNRPPKTWGLPRSPISRASRRTSPCTDPPSAASGGLPGRPRGQLWAPVRAVLPGGHRAALRGAGQGPGRPVDPVHNRRPAFAAGVGLVHLPRGRQELLPAGNVLFVARTETVDEAGPDFGETIESVQSNPTLEVMQELNARVDIDKEDPAEAAEAYLKEFGYIE